MRNKNDPDWYDPNFLENLSKEDLERVNKDLMLEVASHIKENPEAFDMSVVAEKYGSDYTTVACIAGWTLILSGKSLDQIEESSWLAEASELLGLEMEFAEALFKTENWPESYLYRFAAADDSEQEQANIAAELLEDLAAGKIK